MRLYTKTGDKGQTSVIGKRVDKDDIRVEAYGTVDEANAFVGEAMTRLHPDRDGDVLAQLTEIQHELFDCGGDLAAVKGKRPYKMSADKVERLERWIDEHIANAPEVKRFILPGGSPASSALHIARTLVRRAERRAVTLQKHEEINEEAVKYLNRVSDYFFALARVMNAREGVGDVEYVRSGEVFRK